MSGVIRTEPQLETLFADNSSGDITAQDGRDLIASSFGANASGDPSVNDDNANTSGAGYFDVSSRWLNTSTMSSWVCLDGSPGAALWVKMGVLSCDRLSPFTISPVAFTNPSGVSCTPFAWNVVTCSGACTITAPSPAVAGMVFGIRVVFGSAGMVSLVSSGGDFLPGGASTVYLWAGESAELVFDGSNWTKVAGLSLPLTATGNVEISEGPIGYAVWHKCTLKSWIDNSGLMYDSVNSRLVCVRSGIYSVYVSGSFYVDGGARYTVAVPITALALSVNGNRAAAGSILLHTYTGIGGTPVFGGSGMAVLVLGDYLDLWGYCEDGTDGILIEGSTTRLLSFISATEIPSF